MINLFKLLPTPIDEKRLCYGFSENHEKTIEFYTYYYRNSKRSYFLYETFPRDPFPNELYEADVFKFKENARKYGERGELDDTDFYHKVKQHPTHYKYWVYADDLEKYKK
jgi:hypothetical protein